jgi:hypothetical protein
MRTRLPLLDELRVAEPCVKSWRAMRGDDQVRHCDHCDQQVFDLSQLTREEAQNLLQRNDGKLCVKFLRRRDGSIVTGAEHDLPRRSRWRIAAWVASMFTSMFATGCMGAVAQPREAFVPTPTTNASLPELIDPRLEAFRGHIGRMDADQVLNAAIEHFGAPTRHVGSGILTPQWNLQGGVLSVHPTLGPTFVTHVGRTIWLIPTTNLAEENILRDYEMATLPDPANHGTRMWIGNLRIARDCTYRYTDSGMGLNIGDQSNNFFVKHPQGRVRVIWPADVNAQSKLESLGVREVARLHFTSDDGATGEFAVTSSPESRRLTITGETFVLSAGWLRYWANDEFSL